MSIFNAKKSRILTFLGATSLIAFLVFLHTVTNAANGPTQAPPGGYGLIDGYWDSGLGQVISIGGSAADYPYARLEVYATSSSNFPLLIKDESGNRVLGVASSSMVVIGTTTFSNNSQYPLQVHSLRADLYTGTYSNQYGIERYPGYNHGINIENMTVSDLLSGFYPPPSLDGGTARIQNFDSINVDSLILSGNGVSLDASDINPGVFQSGNYAFRWKMGISTSSASTTNNFSAYGDGSLPVGYFTNSTYIKIPPTLISDPGMLNVSSSAGSWLSGWNKGIRLEKFGTRYPSIEFGGGTGSSAYFGAGYRNGQLYIFKDQYEYQFPGTPDFYNLTIASSSVGINIGETSPSSTLHVNGNLRLSGGSGFRLGASATAGYVLTSDASGNGTWQQVSTAISGAGQNYTVRNNGAGWIGSSLLINNSSFIGIGVTTSASDGLTLARVGSGGYFQTLKSSGGGGPSSGDCDSANERGRLTIDPTTNAFYLCMGASGWKQSPDFWYDTAWRYRKKITIDHTKIAAGIIDFPMLVSSTDTGLRDYAQSDGDDIVFTSTAGVKLAHEIENYTSASGNLTAWVRIPQLSSITDTDIYMYYGNSSASNQQNIINTWDSYYKGVWHLKETSGSGYAHLASNASQPSGFPSGCSININGTRNASPIATSSKINIGQMFNGIQSSGNYVSILNTGPCTGFNSSTVTYSAWVKLDSLAQTGGWKGIVGRQTGNDVYHILYDADNEKFGFHIRKDAATDYWQSIVAPTAVTSTSAWYYVTFTNTPAGVFTGYVNGSSVGTVTDATPNYLGLSSAVWIGGDGQSRLQGKIDEVRISNIDRDSNWILTEYNNQSSPSTFYSIGVQE